MKWAWDQHTRSPTSKLLLLKLAEHAHADGDGCFPKVSTIARDTELGERTVREHLRKLEKSGFIVSEAKIDRHGQKANSYRLLLSDGVTSEMSSTKSNGDRRYPPQQRRHKQGVAASAAPTPMRVQQGHIDTNRQNEPSSNCMLKRTFPLSGRALELEKRLGGAQYRDWFGEAEFLEGCPPRIVVPKLMMLNWVIEHFSKTICDVFEGPVIVEVRPEACRGLPERACAPRKIHPRGG